MKKKVEEKYYRLTDSRSGASFTIKTGRDKRLLFFDETEGIERQRAIRHCPNEKSIFVDEQSEHAVVEPIVFFAGNLLVSREAQLTQEFLEASPENVLNGGGLFEIIDDELEAEETIEREELVSEVKQAVRNKGEEDDGIFELEAVTAILINSVARASKMSKSEMKREIYAHIDADPYYFVDEEGNVDIFDNEDMQRKFLVLRAITDGIIKKSPNNKAMLWVSGNKLIATAPKGLDLVDYFADYLSTDDGILVLEEIRRRT